MQPAAVAGYFEHTVTVPARAHCWSGLPCFRGCLNTPAGLVRGRVRSERYCVLVLFTKTARPHQDIPHPVLGRLMLVARSTQEKAAAEGAGGGGSAAGAAWRAVDGTASRPRRLPWQRAAAGCGAAPAMVIHQLMLRIPAIIPLNPSATGMQWFVHMAWPRLSDQHDHAAQVSQACLSP